MLKSGFPWQEPQKSYEAINNGIDWWKYITPRLTEIYTALGYKKDLAVQMAAALPKQYAKLDKWKLYDDTLSSLIQLNKHQWKSVLVTNNIPEFPVILKYLKLESFFEAVYVSSLTGFNKPNPLILNGYLETLPKNAKVIVVGDRVESDLVFAKEIHAEGILVHSTVKDQSPSFTNLAELTGYLLSSNFN